MLTKIDTEKSHKVFRIGFDDFYCGLYNLFSFFSLSFLVILSIK